MGVRPETEASEKNGAGAPGPPPRVVFLTMTFAPEPDNMRGLPLATRLRERGYEVKVLTGFPNYPAGRMFPGYRTRLHQWETLEGVRILRVPIYPSHDMSAMRRIVTYLSIGLTTAFVGVPKIGPADIVYMYDSAPLGLAALFMKAFRGARYVHDVADIWPDTVVDSGMLKLRPLRWAVSGVLGAWCRLLYRQASHIVVLSPGFKRVLAARGVPEGKIHVIYNWVPEDVFRPVPRDESLAAELGMAGRFNVVYAGNIGPMQSIETVVEAAALLREHSEIQIVIIGAGPRDAAVRELARTLGTTNVLFTGRRPVGDMPRINALADALLVHLRDTPLMHVTTPGKTSVSLASGRPVLLGVRGDAADIVREAQAGIAFAPEDARAMADAILSMYRSTPEERQRMGANGREHYLRRMSLEVGGSRLESIFAEMMRNTPGAVSPSDTAVDT